MTGRRYTPGTGDPRPGLSRPPCSEAPQAGIAATPDRGTLLLRGGGVPLRKGGVRVHTHFSAMSALGVFLVVLIVGTAWRLGSYRLAASTRPAARNLAAAMHFQY